MKTHTCTCTHFFMVVSLPRSFIFLTSVTLHLFFPPCLPSCLPSSLSHPRKVSEGDFGFLDVRDVPSPFYFLLPDILICLSVAHWPFFSVQLFSFFFFFPIPSSLFCLLLPLLPPSILFFLSTFLTLCQCFFFFSINLTLFSPNLPAARSLSFLLLQQPSISLCSFHFVSSLLVFYTMASDIFWLMPPSSCSWPFYATFCAFFFLFIAFFFPVHLWFFVTYSI